jgi:hypothetical protein
MGKDRTPAWARERIRGSLAAAIRRHSVGEHAVRLSIQVEKPRKRSAESLLIVEHGMLRQLSLEFAAKPDLAMLSACGTIRRE